MSAVLDLVRAAIPVEGLDGVNLDELAERIAFGLDLKTVQSLHLRLEAESEEERFGRFDRLFPDDGPFARLLYPRHLEHFAAGKVYRERCFMAANRVGKAQPINGPVLTPTGFVPIGSLAVGDKVIGANGKPTKVIGIYPQGHRSVVRLTTGEGSNSLCDRDHLWHVRPVAKGRASRFVTMTAAELQQRVSAGERWALPERPSVQFDQPYQLPMPPYLLGVLLGDGGISNETVLLSTEDPEIVDYARKQAKDYGCELRHAGRCTWHFATKIKRGGRHDNVLASILEGMGLRGKTAHTKRVPIEYLHASEANRLELLRGLMDTDGSCAASQGAKQFYSVSCGLCEDVAFLARSLGMNASVKPKRTTYAGKPYSSWLVHIAATATSVFNLPRKKANERFADVGRRGLVIQSIVDAGEEECVCIEVDAPDHLYLTNDFLVTHNTVAGAYEVACHLTGHYPSWWDGRVFRRPVRAWVAGDTNETTRDILQLELCGEVGWDGNRKIVTGAGGVIKREFLGQPAWKRGVENLIDTVPIKHKSGGLSKLGFKSYDQGRRVFQGTAKEVIWLDEEAPSDVYGECLVRTATTRGILITTFTPLLGISEVVQSFLPKDYVPGEA